MKILRHPLLMRPQPDGDLEQWIDRELRRLPNLRAPATLLPRVIEAIAVRERLPWWRRSFSHWPGPVRIGFLVFSTGLAALLAYFVLGMSTGVSPAALGAEARTLLGDLGSLRTLVVAMGGAGVTLARAAGPLLLWSVLGIGVLSYLTTVALGTVCWRLATQRI